MSLPKSAARRPGSRAALTRTLYYFTAHIKGQSDVCYWTELAMDVSESVAIGRKADSKKIVAFGLFGSADRLPIVKP
jgi:hypothetical protein